MSDVYKDTYEYTVDYRCDLCDKPESELKEQLLSGRTPKGRDYQFCKTCHAGLHAEGVVTKRDLDLYYEQKEAVRDFPQSCKTEPDLAHTSREVFRKEQAKQDMIEKSLMRVIKGWQVTKAFFKKFGLWAVLALVIWLSPSWLSFFIPALKPFAATWLALVISPIMPSWAAVAALAVVLRLLYAGCVWLYYKLKDWSFKFVIGFKMVTLFTLGEIRVILKQGERMKEIKDKAKIEFYQQLDEDRMKLITEHWESTLEEAEGGANRG